MTPTPDGGIVDMLSRSQATMADGKIEMSCREIAIAVTRVAAILDGRNIARADCLAFACDNNLPSAIVLLALLASGRTFLLLPHAAFSIADLGIPDAFCRYRLHVQGQNVASVGDIRASVDSPISVSDNPCWRADPPSGQGRLFVPTSGSTGQAKLVQHSHHLLLEAAGHCAERLCLTLADRVAVPVPVAHMFGLGAAFLPAVLAGASIDLQASANAVRYVARERQFNPTIAFMTPSFGDAITRLRRAPRPYRLTVMAGDRLPADLFDRYEKLHGCLVNLYGSTELGVIAAGTPADPVARRRDMIGRPMQGVTIRNAKAMAIDTLCFRHDYGFEGYVGADGRALPGPDGSLATNANFCSNDVGRMIDGYLTVHGRADDLVNRDGLLVACADVAAALTILPGITEAVILGGDMTRRGRALIAFCVPSPGMVREVGALRKACRGVLPARAIPDQFVFVAELPRLPSGKVDRLMLMNEASASG